MFEGFAGQWTPLLPAAQVTRTPRRIRLAGQDLVAWRGRSGGQPAVLLDRCPHRGVSLALGRVTADGALACAFHGWEFGADGTCRHVPFNPDAPLPRLGGTALPTREQAGFVWVFTGFEPTGEPNLPAGLDQDGLARFDHWEEWDCHWTRAMENMLDFPHLPYIHRSTIGRFVRAKMTRSSRLHMTVTDTDYGFALETRVDDHPPSAALRWYRPHGMVLDTIPAPKLLRLHVWCVPVDDQRTRMFLTAVRNFARNPAASLAMDRFNLAVLHQDRDVVESSMPPVVPAGRGERSVPTDKPTLTFRSWYYRCLQASSVADPRTGPVR